MTVRRALARLLAFIRKPSLDSEFEAEIAAHLELAEKDAVAAGLSPAEARLEARRRFGGVDQVVEVHRETRGLLSLENLLRDLRYGLGVLGRAPGFSLMVIAILGLGIGANVAMFTLIDSVLLKPLPFPHPERIMRLWEAPRPGVTNATSTLDFLDWKRLGSPFEALSAETPISPTLTGAGEPVRLEGKAVTADYFRVFAAAPLLGRTFTLNEDQQNGAAVVVISHSVWQSVFGGERNILHREIVLDGEKHQIIGVMPPGAYDRDSGGLWKLLVFTPDQYLRDSHWLMIHGRLRAGVTVEQAQDQMRAVRAGTTAAMPVWKRDWTLMVQPLTTLLVGNGLRRSMQVLFGAVLLVLLIACANVANLLLAKGASRGREMAVRAALGASRGRLVAQLLTESVALCMLGGAAGLAIGHTLITTATPYLEGGIPYTATLGVDYRVFAFTAGLVLTVALLVGTIPALQISLIRPGGTLREGERGSSRGQHRIRRAIVIAEVALSLVLVCGAALLFRTLDNLQRLETGIRIENVVTMSMSLPAKTYSTAASAARFYASLSEQVKAVPGIEQAALSTHLPLRWIGNGEAVEVKGVKGLINVRFKRIDPGYFAALGIPLLAGRDLTARDSHGAKRVVIINQALARRLAEVADVKNPVGYTVSLHCPRYIIQGADAENVEIVGMIRGERISGPNAPDPNVVYVPLAQVPAAGIKLLVRTGADPQAAVSAIRAAVRQVDPNLPIGEIATMQEVRERTFSGTTRPAWLIGVFAGIAMLLAAIGLYGVLAQTVALQRREIGIRMALGAQSRTVVGHVMRHALSLVMIGAIGGVLGAFALTRVLKNLLFGVSPLDPWSFAAASVAMLLIGVCAACIPAGRAARVDPVTVLRDEG